MIPYSRQTIDQSDIRALTRVLRSDFITQGPAVSRFEQALARYCKAKYAVAVASGTAALHLAYLAAGLKQGSEVIITPNTFAATSNMLLAVGARPVFGDIRLDTYNLDETRLKKLITQKAKAIVSVDFAGEPVEYETIAKIAKKRKLIFISDGSHALGARYKGRPIGSLADLTTFSFHPVKSITTGEGGAILTNQKNYYEKMKLLRSHGIWKDRNGKNVMTCLGFNYRLTDIQAALGISQLRKLDRFIRLRRQVAKWYEEEFHNFDEIILPPSLTLPTRGRVNKKNSSSPLVGEARRGGETRSAWHLYVIRLKNPKLRDPLWQYLLRKGIGANFHYPAVYRHPYYQQNGYDKIRLPNAEIYHRSCLTLPCYPALTRSQVRYVSRAIKSFFQSL